MSTRTKSAANRAPSWAQRVRSLIQSGNHTAAVSQIRACAELADVQQLEKQLLRLPNAVSAVLAQALADQVQELSHPRLHRSP